MKTHPQVDSFFDVLDADGTKNIRSSEFVTALSMQVIPSLTQSGPGLFGLGKQSAVCCCRFKSWPT